MSLVILQQQSRRSAPPVVPVPPTPLYFTAEQIHDVLGSPMGNVAVFWPLLDQALTEFGIFDRLTAIAAIATIGVEDSAWTMIEEYSGGYEYEGRSDLGNTEPGDGHRYMGRGPLQLTGRANYRWYGTRLGIPLEEQPELALVPEYAARIFALFFADHGIQAMASTYQWSAIRRAVNGGTNGLAEYLGYVSALLKL